MPLFRFLVALLIGLGPQAPEWPRVLPGLELSFPADHGAHFAFKTEWWYITGQVESETGRRYGFQFTVFRRGMHPGSARAGESPMRARQVLAGHLALTDVAGGRTRFADRLRRSGSGLAYASESDLDLALEDWSLRRSEQDRLSLSAGDAKAGIALEFELVPAKPLVLQGRAGYSSKGEDPGNASAYTSWTRLVTTGNLEVDGESMDVVGTAWFDHEFGSSVLEPGLVGWDWFGLQLDDGRELMLFRLRREDGGFAPASAGTLIERDGTTRAFGADAFDIERQASWTSPRSSAIYPASWTLSIPSAGLNLEIVPLVPDCEVGGAQATGVAYWEGPVEVRGSVQGRGYAELTGYAGSMDGRF